MDPELPAVFLANDPNDMDMDGGNYDGEIPTIDPEGLYVNQVDGREDDSGSDNGGSDDSRSSCDDEGRRSHTYNGDDEMPTLEEEEFGEREDDDDDSDSSSSDSATTSSSSHRRVVVKNVQYFAKQNLDRYLKRRGFDVYQKPPSTVGLDKLIENLQHAYEGYSRVNPISVGTNYDGEDVIKEITRLWDFYRKSQSIDKSAGSQLKSMLVPAFVCLYQECLLFGSVQYAVKMFSKFVNQFFQECPTDENRILFSMLANTCCSSNFDVSKLKENPLIKHLSIVEYKFNVSHNAFELLQKLLQTAPSPVLPNLFTQRFKISVLPDSTENLEEPSVLNEPGNTAEVESESPEVDIKSVLHQLRGSLAANLPSILVHTTNEKCISGAVSLQGTLLAYGMEDAGIRIFETPMAQGGLKNTVQMPVEGKEFTAAQLNGHTGSVYDLAFHPKAKYLFSVGEDALMRVWDVSRRACRAVYRGHHCPIWSLDITGSGNLIATGGMDTTARIWVPERTDFLRMFVGHYFDVDCVRFHPNEAYIATGSIDKSVRLWSVSNGNLVRMFTGSTGAINALTFHESGKYIAGAGEDNLIRIWELGEGKLIAQLEANSNCRDLNFHKDMLAAGFANGTVRIWSVRDILQTTSSFPEQDDLVSDCESYAFDAKAERMVNLHYKNVGELICLASTTKK